MPVQRSGRRVIVSAVAVFAALGALVLGGCADNQPGDTNNGPGISDQPADLAVKVPALQGDPCRGAQATQLFPNCGRFVTEVSNIVTTLQSELPNQDPVASRLQSSAASYLQLGCGTLTGKPSSEQSAQCPLALHNIGTELDELDKALAAMPTAGNSGN